MQGLVIALEKKQVKEATVGRSIIRGLYRLHQFSKVEMFSLVKPEESNSEHQRLLDIEIELLKKLQIPFRVLDMPTEELGNSAYRKYDIEMYMPSKKGFGEVTSATNCTDYQSMRLNINYMCNGEKKLVHTLNATAMAVPRMIMAILENYAKEDGSVTIPDTLRKYMFGIDQIKPKKQ